MFLFLLFLFSVLFLMGAAICLISVAKYTTYAETDGEIIDYLQCNPVEDEQHQEKQKEEDLSAVVVAYNVSGKTYHLATNIKSNKKTASASGLKVLYNPYFPDQSRLKEGTPFLGSVLMVSSLICLIVLFFFF